MKTFSKAKKLEKALAKLMASKKNPELIDRVKTKLEKLQRLEAKASIEAEEPEEVNGDAPAENGGLEDMEVESSLPGTGLLASSGFSDLGICEPTLQGLRDMGLDEMMPVQRKAIPHLLQGRDLMATAKTGSGKTLAFLVPAVELVYKLEMKPRNGTGCVIISPTRELSLQTYGVLQELVRHHSMRVGLVMGGTNRAEEARNLSKGCTILVATPGRLLDHLQNTEHFLFKNLKCLVLDEADRILQVGFEEEMRQILRLLPSRRQTMLFTATLNAKTRSLAQEALKTQCQVVEEEEKDSEEATVEGLEQGYVVCPADRRFCVLYTFLKKNRGKKLMVFMSSCLQVKFFYELLNYIDLPVLAIHGKQKQAKRTQTFFQFCSAKDGILICTDVAARGLDIPQVDWIVQFDPPDDPKEYIHRVGRTARAGASGRALLLLRDHELRFLLYLRASKVKVIEYDFAWSKVADIQPQLERLLSKNYYLNRSAQEAYKGFVRAYASHSLKKVFDVHQLDLRAAAQNFGLTTPPLVDLDVKFSKASRRRSAAGFQNKRKTGKASLYKKVKS